MEIIFCSWVFGQYVDKYWSWVYQFWNYSTKYLITTIRFQAYTHMHCCIISNLVIPHLPHKMLKWAVPSLVENYKHVGPAPWLSSQYTQKLTQSTIFYNAWLNIGGSLVNISWCTTEMDSSMCTAVKMMFLNFKCAGWGLPCRSSFQKLRV